MHPIVVYVLVKARMEQDREAERRRLARSEIAAQTASTRQQESIDKRMARCDFVSSWDQAVLA